MKRPLWVLAGILLLAGVNALQGAGPDTQWLGVLWTKGSVSVGDARVSSGATVLPGDVITTDEGSSAWIRFRFPASTILLADSQVTLVASDTTPSFLLRKGTLVVDEKLVDPVQVSVPGGIVLVKGDTQTGAACEVAEVGNASTVSVKRGTAEIYAQGAPVTLHAGESARVEAGPQGGEPVAGKINKVIPQGSIQHEGQIQELPLQLNAVVDWNDMVQTRQTGRAQITLLDGSTLNVGARSQLKILKHDPQAQQTEIALVLGRVEANVQKITAPGGKFQMTTKSAVIGTIDTAFVADSNDSGTRVCGVDGTTQVKSADPNQTKTVRLHRNECTFVPFGGVPTDPVLSPSELSSLLNQTIIGGTVGGAGAGGGGTAGAWALGLGMDAAIGAAVSGVVLTYPKGTSVYVLP